MKKIPKGLWNESEFGMSNLGPYVDRGLGKDLKENERYAVHAAWDFCGYLWWEGSYFFEEIWVYGSHVNTVKSRSLKGLMETANAEYGYG